MSLSRTPSCRVRRGATLPSRFLDSPEPATRSPLDPSVMLAAHNFDLPIACSRPRSRTLSSIFTELTSVYPRSQLNDTTSLRNQFSRSTVSERTGQFQGTGPSDVIPCNRPAPPESGRLAGYIDVNLLPNESLRPSGEPRSVGHGDHHEDEVVEHLEVIDPQVATVSHLSNAANSILIPPLSPLYSRRPVISLPKVHDPSPQDGSEKGHQDQMDELDVHVKDVFRRRDRLRRSAAGLWSYVKTPVGALTAIYGFCVVFWGAAIVLFLAGWIPTSSKDRRSFWVEVSSQVENGLFTITGIGLIPWRVLDTYRILHIWKYKQITRKMRKKAGLPELKDEDDLPDPMLDTSYIHVLTDRQQNDLRHQQREFAKSQTWYRPHATSTHKAFPIVTALLICFFVDGNSVFQIILCGCMWGLDRFKRPPWTTGTLIPASFMCGIVAAFLIWKGGQKTAKVETVEAKLRAALIDVTPKGVSAVDTPVTMPIREQPISDIELAELSPKDADKSRRA